MIGVCGLFFFIVGYARERKDLSIILISHCFHQNQRYFLPIATLLLPPSTELSRMYRTSNGGDSDGAGRSADRGGSIPSSGTVVASLAEQEADLLEGLGESVFARHVCSRINCVVLVGGTSFAESN